jgi:hypothetical protein
MSRLGRFTVRGGAEVEGLMARLSDEIADVAGRVLPAGSFKALVMIGGYGRGEGGVDARGGVQRPHNNVDLLLVTTGGRPPDAPRSALQDALDPIGRRYGIGIDVGAVAERTLRWAPCRVIWYDMRFGHKTIAGDPGFVPSLDRFTAERILPSDARDLLVNRGTLLLLNDALLADGPVTPEREKALLRHAAKAVIGYGDALLFFLGEYHWSYQEKRRRLLARDDVSPSFRDLYDRAAEYRLEPGGDLFGRQGAEAWTESVRPLLAEVHLACERARLSRPGLTWAEYPEAALRHAARESALSPRSLARTALGRGASSPAPRGLSTLAGIGWRLTSPRERLALLFPAVAYPVPDSALGPLAASLEAGATRSVHPRDAYLRTWGEVADSNFGAALARLGLDLGRREDAA